MLPIPTDQPLTFSEIADLWAREERPGATVANKRSILVPAWWQGRIVGRSGPRRIDALRGLFRLASERAWTSSPDEPSPLRVNEMPGSEAITYDLCTVPLPNLAPLSWNDTNCTLAFEACAAGWKPRDNDPVLSAIMDTEVAHDEFAVLITTNGDTFPEFWTKPACNDSRSDSTKLSPQEGIFFRPFWSVDEAIAWIAFRNRNHMNVSWRNAQLRPSTSPLPLRCYRAPFLFVRALQSGDVPAIENDQEQPRERWAGFDGRRWPAAHFRREDMLLAWPEYANENSAGVALRPASERQIHKAITDAYNMAEGTGEKPPNIKELPTQVSKILDGCGLKSSGRNIMKLGEDPRHAVRRRPPGPTLASERERNSE